MYILLSDNTRVDNCLEGTTSDYIIHGGETHEQAASILDVLTPENTTMIQVFNDNDERVAFASDLILLPGGTIEDRGNSKVCIVKLRHKTAFEKMQDEITELQEVVIEE